MNLFAVATENFNIPLSWWVGTMLWFAFLLALDLFIHRNNKDESNIARSGVRSAIWISLGLMLGGIIWYRFGHDAGTKYFSGFFIEKSLSVDNIFVWGIIFSYLKTPAKYTYKVLYWGILGAIFFRILFVLLGVTFLQSFQFTFVILGGLLLYTAIKLMRSSDIGYDPNKSKIIQLLKKHIGFTDEPSHGKMFIMKNGKPVATVIFLAVLALAFTDVLFAIDSVPAVLAVARDPYIVIASNIAALLGLRALYFLFSDLRESFWLLNRGLALILGAIGLSLILEPTSIFGISWFGIDLPSSYELTYVSAILALSIVGSLLIKNPKKLSLK